MSEDLASAIRRLADAALTLTRGSELEDEAQQVIRRFDEPLRVAIAGRTKAGKSTLLNALVGERLAATDAGECTRIVTWYRYALGYSVSAELRERGRRDLTFRRQQGELEIELGDLDPEGIDRIDVGWPSQKLVAVTLIDTPGLGSTDQATSERTTEALLEDGLEGPGEADAVIYLMRHLHRSDAQFLEAFTDRSISQASPINAIVVLSRADEIGAARTDALDSARAVAARYASDPRVKELASGVVPVAGLLAETGATLREQEFAWLRDLANLDAERREALLRSVDRFRDADLHPHGWEIREDLLRRFGLYGLRTSIALIVDGQTRNATELSAALLALSGIRDLQRQLSERYTARARALKARTALAALRSIADRLEQQGVAPAADLVADIERVASASHEIDQLRLAHLVLTGLVQVSPEERVEIERLSSPGSLAEQAGLTNDAGPDETRATALRGVERWRARMGDPFSDRRTIEAAEIICRAYEEIYSRAG
jgi:GTP-binding protein EngB required for normal cell division